MTGPYGRLIADYRESGLHPFPVAGKAPCVKAYASSRPSPITTKRWATVFSDANLGLPTRREGLVVLDIDHPSAAAIIEAAAGRSPLRVGTRQGEHAYFADPRREFRGVIHPNGQQFDIKGAGSADYVLLPGSVNGDATYTLLDYDGDDPIAEFARRLADLPPLSAQAYQDLVRRPSGLIQVSWPVRPASNTVLLDAATVPQGARNLALFLATCREAHEIRRRHGDGDVALAALADRMVGVNAALCLPPLGDVEVERLVRGVWTRTLVGINRPPPSKSRHIRAALQRMGKEARGLVLWGWLTETATQGEDIELAPVRVARAIPGWGRHDAEAAIKALVAQRVLRLVGSARRGRGNATRYRLLEPLLSRVSFTDGLHRLGGDADALALLVLLAETWGPEGEAPISAEGMARQLGGPFGRWTRVKIVKARDRLESAQLIERLPDRRISVRRPRAMFQLRATGVLKMLEIVPVDIHRPPALEVRQPRHCQAS